MSYIKTLGGLQNLSNGPDIGFQYQDNGQPWPSIAAAHAGTPAAYRAIGKIRFVDDGSGLKEYWYKDGIELVNLVRRFENLETPQEYLEELNEIKDDTNTLKVAAGESAEIALNAATGVINAAGTYNALTGEAFQEATDSTPAETFTPTAVSNKPNGYFLDVIVAGSQSITGTSVAMKVGGRVRSKGVGAAWVYRDPSDLALEKALDLEEKTKDLVTDLNDDKVIFSDPAGYKFFESSPEGTHYVGQVTPEQIEELEANFNQAIEPVKNVFGILDQQFSVADPDGNEFFRVTVDGPDWNGRDQEQADLAEALEKAEVATTKTQHIYPDLYPGEVIVCDDNGYIISRQNDQGFDYYGKSSGGGSTGEAKPTLVSDVIQIPSLSQSLGVSGSVVAPVDFYDTKAFPGGILCNYDPDVAGAADTYFGSGFVPIAQNGTETQLKALAKILKELIRDENGIAMADQSFVPVVNAAGTSGASYAQLTDVNGDQYRRLIESVKRAKDFALASGKTFSVPVFVYVQGEASTDRFDSAATWSGKLDTFFTSLNTTIKGISGQIDDVQFIVYQIASDMGKGTGVPLGFLKLAQEKANVHFGCAMYQMEYLDLLHVTSTSYRLMGAMMGVVAKRAIVDKQKMQPIFPASHTIQKNEANTIWAIRMKMNAPVYPLVFDESVNSLFTTPPAHKGFVIKNGSGTDIVTNVTLVNGDTVNIFCSENPAGLTLSYAIGGRTSGGNLRDSQGDNVKISCEGVIKRVDNWAPIFEITI